jgi:hypothetical protein
MNVLKNDAEKVKRVIDLICEGKELQFCHNDGENRPYNGINLSEIVMSPCRFTERPLSISEQLESEKDRIITALNELLQADPIKDNYNSARSEVIRKSMVLVESMSIGSE